MQEFAQLLLDRAAREQEFARRYDTTDWQLLGTGGFGLVVRLKERDLDRYVAVKLVKPDVEMNPDVKRRLQAEVVNNQNIRSERAVRIHTAFLSTPFPWLEMEYVDGPNLEQAMERRGERGVPLSPTEALDYAIAATEALHDAHQKGIIHRDVKPSNYLLPADGQPLLKLGDFGISKSHDDPHKTTTGQTPGTIQWQAPEISAGGQATEGSDVYSLGMLVFWILTGGVYPYEVPPKQTHETLRAHQTQGARRLRDHAPLFPLEIDALLLRSMSKPRERNRRQAPPDRPSTGEILQVLRDARVKLSGSAPLVHAAPARAPITGKRVAVAAAVTAIVLVTALTLTRQTEPPAATAAAAGITPTTPPASLSAPALPLLRVEKDELANIVLVNTGRERVRVAELVFEDARSIRYTAKPTEYLDPAGTLGLAGDAFTPVPPKNLSGHLTVTFAVSGKTETHRYPWPPQPWALRLDGGWLSLTNDSGQSATNLRLEVRTADGVMHTATEAGPIAHADQVLIGLDEFRPPLEPSATIASTRILARLADGERTFDAVAAAPVRLP